MAKLALTDDLIGETGTMICRVALPADKQAVDPRQSHRRWERRIGKSWRVSDGRTVRCVGVECLVDETGMGDLVTLLQHVEVTS